ncbi:MAG: TadE/TadG family type IV pilus assembly protein [Candidatus Methylacidiphilales bacterium]
MNRVCNQQKEASSAGISKRKNGQSSVEFALMFPLFIMLILSVVDVARFVFIEQTMTHITRTTLRYGVTGQRMSNPKPTGPTDLLLNWSDSLIAFAKMKNPTPSLIQVNKADASFKIYMTDTPSSTYPAIFPNGEKVSVDFTQPFNFVTPFANLMKGKVLPDKIVIKTTYTMEK